MRSLLNATHLPHGRPGSGGWSPPSVGWIVGLAD